MNLSGNAYVPIRPRWVSNDTPTTQLKILQAFHCGHGETICEDCADDWERDYLVLFARTAGGRALAGRMGKQL